MSKRKWTNIKALEPEIIAMRKARKIRREIAEHFGLEKEQIKNREKIGSIGIIENRLVWPQFYRSKTEAAPEKAKQVGHDPTCNESREKEGRRRVAAPQRPRLSVYLTSVL